MYRYATSVLLMTLTALSAFAQVAPPESETSETLPQRPQNTEVTPWTPTPLRNQPKSVLIANIDAQTGSITDDWATQNQVNWLKDWQKDVAKGKASPKLQLTSRRDEADYILLWTAAQGFRPYITYVPRTETSTANVFGGFNAYGTSGQMTFGNYNGTVVVNRTYYEAQAGQTTYVDVVLTVYDRTGKKLYETWHQGNWAWSKPDKDCLEDAFNFLARLPGDSNTAMIWFYRSDSIHPKLDSTIYSRGEALGRLEKGRFFALEVPPDTYYFSWTDKPTSKDEAWVTAPAGSITFFKVGNRKIEPVNAKNAAKDFRNLKPLEWESILSPHVDAEWPPF